MSKGMGRSGLSRALLAGTALVGVAAFATGASAAEKIRLGLGGYFNAYFAYGAQSDGSGEPGANVREHGIGREGEVYFTGETTLDNGLTASVVIQLEAETSTDQIDESYIAFKGGFGHLHIGSDDPATDSFLISAPGAVSGFGVNDPTFTNISTGGNSIDANVTTVGISGDNDKVIYLSPSISGLSVGVSYAPDATEESADGLRSDNDAGDQSREIALAAGYSRTVGALSFALYAGYAKANLEAAGGGFNDDQRQWGVGGEIGMAGVKVGASFREDNQGTSGAHTDRRDWNVGVGYETGPWAFSLGYGRTEIEEGAGAGEDTLDVTELAANYVVAPGLAVGSTVSYWDYQDNAGTKANENQATLLTFGVRVDF